VANFQQTLVAEFERLKPLLVFRNLKPISVVIGREGARRLACSWGGARRERKMSCLKY